MSNRNATITVSLSYTGPSGEMMGPPAVPDLAVTAPYAMGAQAVGGIDIADATAADTEYSLPFGSVAAATALELKNQSGQQLLLRLNGAASVTGTLAVGTVTLGFSPVAGERLSVARVATHGTAGVLSVRRLGGNVVVESWTTDGIQDLDLSDVIVFNNAPPALPDGALLVYVSPVAAQSSQLKSASVMTTDVQSGAGSVAVKVFGDPA